MLSDGHEIEIQPVHIGAEEEPTGRHRAADPHHDRYGKEGEVEQKECAQGSEPAGHENPAEEHTRDDQAEVEDWYEGGDQAFAAARVRKPGAHDDHYVENRDSRDAEDQCEFVHERT